MPKRSNRITILVVPEDDQEPRSYRLKTKLLPAIYVVGVLLLLHMIVGGIFYWKYADLQNYTDDVLARNNRLREDNKRVVALADQFYALEREYQKVRSLLGVEPEINAGESAIGSTIESKRAFDNIIPAVKTTDDARTNVMKGNQGFLLTPRRSKLHAYAENLPTLLPVKGILTQDFQKDGWFGPRRHSGIDIVSRKGNIVRAAGAGIIVFANWTYDLGNLVIVNHGDGLLSYYGHNQRILKPEMSHVKKGEPIALVGSTGKSSGPHLHFEIRQDGQPVDPKKFVLAFRRNTDN